MPQKMASKIELIVLYVFNYVVWVTNMETLLKSKGLQHYEKVVILDLSHALAKFVIDGKKDEVVGIIMTYIS